MNHFWTTVLHWLKLLIKELEMLDKGEKLQMEINNKRGTDVTKETFQRMIKTPSTPSPPICQRINLKYRNHNQHLTIEEIKIMCERTQGQSRYTSRERESSTKLNSPNTEAKAIVRITPTQGQEENKHPTNDKRN